MAKIKINERELNSKIARRIKELKGAAQSEALLEAAGRQAVKDIKRETQTGRGFRVSQTSGNNSDNSRTKLPKLAKATVEARRYLDDFNRNAPTYSPARSNLTFTGQLIKSIQNRVARGKAIIEAVGNRRPYRTAKGKLKSAPSNPELVEFLDKKGFHFLGVDDNTIQKIKTIAVRQIRRLLRS